MAGTYDLEIDRGGTFTRIITAVDASNVNYFAAATNAQASIRETINSTTPVANFTCTFATNNASLTISLDANTTNSLVISRGVWDLRIIFPDKVVYPLAGAVFVNPRVTHP